ncbi:MAG: hypothetical protein O2944_04050 [Proteobacteria bacterium]|nr:hypothetical protein [Pseudomonadota bacterium]
MLTALANLLIAYRARRDGAAKRGIVLVSSGGLGDTILFSLILPRFLELIGPDEPATLIVRNESAQLRFLFPERVNVIGIDYRRFIRDPFYKLRTAEIVRGLNARIAVSTDHLRLPTVDDVLILASGAAERYALEPRSWPKHDAQLRRQRGWYSRLVAPTMGMAHRLIRWWELANALGGRSLAPPVVRLGRAQLPPPLAKTRPRIVLHPFSAIAERETAPEVFIAIAEAYALSHEIVLSAGPGDLERAPRHRTLAELPWVSLDQSDFTGKAALVRSADLVVSVDTSLMHLAAGSGVPTLCLASAAHIVDSVPYDSRIAPPNARFEVPEIDCAGCLGQCIHPLENGRYLCLSQITPARALAAARDMLER